MWYGVTEPADEMKMNAWARCMPGRSGSEWTATSARQRCNRSRYSGSASTYFSTIHEQHSSMRRMVSSTLSPVRGVAAGSRLMGMLPPLYSTCFSGSFRDNSISRGSVNSGWSHRWWPMRNGRRSKLSRKAAASMSSSAAPPAGTGAGAIG